MNILFRVFISFVFLFFLLFSSPAMGKNDIKLSSDVINGRLIPTVMINGNVVMKIQDRGDRKKFVSTFDRAENIVKTMIEFEEKGHDLNDLRIRRVKNEYSAVLKRTLLFTISEGDVFANKSSAYQLASSWVYNIEQALKVQPDNGEYVDLTIDLQESKSKYPLLFLLKRFTKDGVVYILIEILFVIVLQLIVAYLVAQYWYNKQGIKEKAIQARLDKYNYMIVGLKQEINDIRKEMDLVNSLNGKDRK